MTATATKSLLEALLAVQAEVPTLRKNETATVKSDKGSYKYHYIGLDTIVEKIGPILNKHGLVWITKPGSDEQGRPALHYTLAHAPSGEREDGTMVLLLAKSDAQSMGSAITYARRYSLCAVLNLVADEDDDGGEAGRPRSDAPSGEQMQALARQVKANQPTTDVLREMLKKVGASVPVAHLEDGSWAHEINRQHVSGLLDIFKQGSLPDGTSDIPTDDPGPEPEA